MSEASRRQILIGAASVSLATAAGLGSGLAQGGVVAADKFDLVIKGGEVLDPSQSLRGQRDIGIRYGRIEALEADIPAERATRLLDASGKLVTPGLVDLHSHVYPYGSAIGIPADELAALPVHHDLRLGGRCGREQLRGLPAPHRGADAHPALRFRAHRQCRAHALPGARALQHRLRAGRRLRQDARRERRHGDRREGAHVRERDREARARAAEARHHGLRARRHRREGHVPHRRGRDARADVPDPRPAPPRRRADPRLFRARRTSRTSSPTSCRTAAFCRRRSRRSSAA